MSTRAIHYIDHAKFYVEGWLRTEAALAIVALSERQHALGIEGQLNPRLAFVNFRSLARNHPNTFLPVEFYPHKDMAARGFTYVSIGRPAREPS